MIKKFMNVEVEIRDLKDRNKLKSWIKSITKFYLWVISQLADVAWEQFFLMDELFSRLIHIWKMFFW